MNVSVNEVPTEALVVEFSCEDQPGADEALLLAAAEYLGEHQDDQVVSAFNVETDVMHEGEGLALSTLRLVLLPVPS